MLVSGRGRIAVVDQITGSTTLPKGHVEAGESLEDAAAREILEEVGITAGLPLKRFPRYSRQSGVRPAEQKSIVMFLYLLVDEPDLVSLDPANVQPRWLMPEDTLQALSYIEDRRFLQTVLPEVFRLRSP